VEGELTVFDGQGAVLVTDGAKVAALGAGLLGWQRLGLLLHEGAESALDQATSGRSSDLLHRLEVDVGARAGLAEDAASDDFAPASGQILDLLEFLSRDGALRHGQSCLVVAWINGEVFLLPLYCRALWLAKPVLASR
jgi:hypothetical protein